jgi:2-methylcitrate dehydratase PrpD
VAEDKAMTDAWPATVPARVDVVREDGSRWTGSADYPRGHPQRPATVEDIERKFMSLTPRVLGDARARDALDLLGRLDSLHDVASIFPALAAQ